MPLKKSGVGEIGKPAAPWFVSYSDLVTQMLIFFVMFFAISDIATEDQLRKIKIKIDKYVNANNLGKYVVTDITLKKGLIISIREKYMFDTAKADIYPEAQNLIRDIVELVRHEPNRIDIEGHTDIRPINTREFPSNWELSTARATNVTKFLIEELGFNPKRLSSAGYSEYHPVAPNDTPENMAKNRRVDIIIRRLDLDEMREWREKLKEEGKKAVHLDYK